MKSWKGFTLLEVLIAVSILVGGVLVIGQSWSGNFMRVRKSSLYHNVASLLEKKVVEIEAFYHGKSIEEIPEEDSGDFGSDYPQYRWEMRSQDFEMPDLRNVLISREEGANDMLLMVIQNTQEFISKSVKEVTVSVFVKAKTKEIEYSVTTYFVDYNQELTLGGLGGGGGTQ